MSAPESDHPQGEGETPPAERPQSLAESLAALKSSAQGLTLSPGFLRFMRTGEPPFPRNNWLEDLLAKSGELRIPPRTAAGEYLRTIALVEAVRGTLPAESPAVRLEEETERLRRILDPAPSPPPGLNPADYHHPPPLPRPPTAEEIGEATARHLSQADPGDVEELRERIAELEARLVPPPSTPADEPKSRTQARRDSLARILEALRELDPQLNTAAMPGQKGDFLEMCQALAPHLFFIGMDQFKKTALKGQAKFTPGAQPTTYYREKIATVRAKLG